MSIIDVDALVASARLSAKTANWLTPANPEPGDPAPQLASISQLAKLAISQEDETEVRRLLKVLAKRASWTAEDVADGEGFIAHAPADAVALFREMLARHPEDVDGRLTCNACRNLKYGRCTNHRRAGLDTNIISSDLAALPQWCPGHSPT